MQFINMANQLKSILFCCPSHECEFLALNFAISMTFIGGKIGLVNTSADTQKYNSVNIKNLSILNTDDIDIADKQQMSDFLKTSTNKFDVVVIDSVPLTESICAASIASVVDGVVICAAAKKTQREFLVRNYKILNEIKARVLGALLQW